MLTFTDKILFTCKNKIEKKGVITALICTLYLHSKYLKLRNVELRVQNLYFETCIFEKYLY